MPEPIRRLNPTQFALLLDAATLDRQIDAIHLHHTRQVRQRDFRGLATLEALRHQQVATYGWPDIAQHLTIDPAGGLWTGRNWNVPPASGAGHNGTPDKGPFMIELVGDFDLGRDPFGDAQREATVDVVARLFRRAGLDPATSLVFHRDLDAATTCPGVTIDRAALVTSVRHRVAEIGETPRVSRPLFPVEHLAGFSITQSSAALSPASAEVPEHDAAARIVDGAVHQAIASRQRARAKPAAQIGPRDSSEWTELKPHVINLSRGELSEGGEFETTPADVDAILDGIRAYAAAAPDPRVVLYAHGGLVDERDALEYARTVRAWWIAHGVYPVFFVWESGLLEILRQYIIGPRAWTDVTDGAIEIMATGPGSLIWSGMKESARRACTTDIGLGYPGGARLFADRLAALVSADAPRTISLHAVGHSAGAIFHAHLLPVLVGHGLTIDTTCLLAPAVRLDLFSDRLLAHVQQQRIARLTMFTMEEDAERQDDCWTIYRKSLLYFVSRSFEGAIRRPILGLHESIREDVQMRALFGIDAAGRPTGASSPAELQLSRAPGSDPNQLTRGLRHGAFDNDPHTMSAVLRRVLGVDDATELGFSDFPWPPAEDRAYELPVPVFTPIAAETTAPAAPPVVPSTSARRLALCVGIDAYPDRPLRGCVNDARAWGVALRQLGFEVRYLLDRKATRASVLDGLGRIVTAARPGDVMVFQYSGHGTQLKDTSGDESDPFDEAVVPIDYADGAFLIDDDIADVLGQLPDGGLLTMFMDCCHSGTISRFAPAIRPVETMTDRVRYLPVDTALEERHQEFSARVRAVRGVGLGSRPATATGRERALRGVIQFAACRDDEYAWESDGHGDFTTAATRIAADAAARGDTNESFIQSVARAVAPRNRQHPMLLPPAAGLERRPLLVPLAGDADRATPVTRDAEVAYHVEALARLLRVPE